MLSLRKASSPAVCRLLIILAVPLTFSRLLHAEFLTWDDWFNLSHNPWLNPPTWASVTHYWQHPAYGLYIPITYMAWAGLAAMGYVQQADPSGTHLNPYLFHAANIATHLIATLMVFQILLRLNFSPMAACIAALLFGLHPVQVEAIAWTAGFKDLLAGTLALVALALYLNAAMTRRRSVGIYAIATVVAAAAMLSKPSALTIAPIALVLDRFWLRRPWATVLRWCAPWLILAIGCAIVGKIVQPAVGVTPAPWSQRPLVVADALAHYFSKMVWPRVLTIDYGRTPTYLASPGGVDYVRLICFAGVAQWLCFADRRIRVGFAAFLLALTPTSGLVTFLYQYYSTVADHYLYLPMFGIAIIAAQLIVRYPKVAVPISVFFLVYLSVRSFTQTSYWQNDTALFGHALAANRRSFMSADNLGQSFLNAGETDDAERLFRRAIEIKPDDVQAQTRVAEILETRGDFAEAVTHRRAALAALLRRPPELRVDLLATLNGLVRSLISSDQREAARTFQTQAEQLGPTDPQVVENSKQLAEP